MKYIILTILFIVLVVGAIIVSLCFQKETKEFWKDVFVIVQRNNIIKTFWITFIIAIIGLSGLLGYFYFSDKQNFIIGLVSFFVSIVGVYISARIMMEVERKRTKTIEDYLRMTRNIVRNAHDGDHIYIIAPTFCAGIIEHKRLLDNLFNNIEKKKEKVNFHFAFLKTHKQENEFEEINFLNNKSDIDTEIIQKVKPFDSHWKMISPFFVPEIERDTKNVGKHEETRKTEIREEIKAKIKLVNSYEERLNGNGERIHLSEQTYLNNNDGKFNVFGGFFATVNLGKLQKVSDTGQYYLGYFHHDGEKTIFKGTSFEVEGIGKNMQTFLESFLEYRKNKTENGSASN